MSKLNSLLLLLLLVPSLVRAQGLGFEPLPSSVEVGSLPETSPFLLASGLRQELVTSLQSSPGLPVISPEDGAVFQGLGFGNPTGQSNFDMLTLNETGPDQGRYLFRTHEFPGFCSVALGGCAGGNSGVSRTDLQTGVTTTIVQRADLDSLDGIVWTPWGSLLVTEETSSFEFGGAPVTPNLDPSFPDALNGLVYEITNPLAAPEDITIVARPALGSLAHEGIKFDADGSFYVIDEFPLSFVGNADLGAIYKFVPSTPGDLSAGQLFALKDTNADDGAQVGAAEWAPLNDINGNPIAGVTDPRIDARTAANDVGATEYDRPEDLEIGRLANGRQALYAATTTDHRVLSIELGEQPVVRNFVDRDTIDLSSGMAVGDGFQNPDNLAIDVAGHIYIVEDNNPGDIWTAVDADGDGVAEGIGRWASLSTLDSEPSGLYFSPFDANVAFVNVQHPRNRPPADALGDATFRILVPEPASLGLLAAGGVLAMLGCARRRRVKAHLSSPGRCRTAEGRRRCYTPRRFVA